MRSIRFRLFPRSVRIIPTKIDLRPKFKKRVARKKSKNEVYKPNQTETILMKSKRVIRQFTRQHRNRIMRFRQNLLLRAVGAKKVRSVAFRRQNLFRSKTITSQH